jgi:hypothetical protein
MNKVFFPFKCGQRYWPIHHSYLLNVFAYAGVDIEFKNFDEISDVFFTMEIDGKKVVVCFSDDPVKLDELYDKKHIDDLYNYPVLKFHFSRDIQFRDNIIPITPVSFHVWRDYYKLKDSIRYPILGKRILNCQKASGNALKRRGKVYKLLEKHFPANLDTRIVDQHSFFLKINDCLVSVCVPGYCNNMIDRGQLQYMAFGCCTISPRLPEMLPFGHSFIEDGNYVVCKDDYSDLVEKINWCSEHRSLCSWIGDNAKKMFEQSSTPQKLVEWIDSNL